jgi:hypothetical protein
MSKKNGKTSRYQSIEKMSGNKNNNAKKSFLCKINITIEFWTFQSVGNKFTMSKNNEKQASSS